MQEHVKNVHKGAEIYHIWKKNIIFEKKILKNYEKSSLLPIIYKRKKRKLDGRMKQWKKRRKMRRIRNEWKRRARKETVRRDWNEYDKPLYIYSH